MYIKFTNLDDFNVWHNDVMHKLGIPDGLGTEVYSAHVVHPGNNSVVATIDERVDTEGFEVYSDEDLFDLGYKIRPAIPSPF
jgi:hypothetical protein